MKRITRDPHDLINSLSDPSANLELSDKIAYAIEHYIANLPLEKQAHARQELPYLVQFWPTLIRYGKMLPDIRWVNPGIRYGGLTEYEKHTIYNLLPEKYRLSTIDIPYVAGLDWTDISTAISLHAVQFPLMKKANKWERGVGIWYMSDIDELYNHWQQIKNTEVWQEDFSLQEYCTMEQEYCLQFYQYDGNIHVGSLTLRDIPYVIGNNQRILRDLISELSLATHHERNVIWGFTDDELWTTIPTWEKVYVTRKASIDFGTKYRTVSLHQTHIEQLYTVLRDILCNMPETYIWSWRFDIKANSLDDLLAWRCKIIECNAGWGIPTHVYDESLSIDEKYGELNTHFDLLAIIAEKNKKWESTVDKLLNRPSMLYASYQSISKKEIVLFDDKNKQYQEISAIYKQIRTVLLYTRKQRWGKRWKRIMRYIIG